MMKSALEKIVRTLSLQELVEAQNEIKNIIVSKQNEEKNRLRDVFIELATKAGLTIFDIFGVPEPTKMKVDKRTSPKPKYRNPDNAEQTWSGRGRRPLWVQEYLGKHDWDEKLSKEETQKILNNILIDGGSDQVLNPVIPALA